MRHHANTLALNNIYDELVPLGLWHCRNIDNLKYPILDDVLAHHNACKHKKYLKVRDGANRTTWSQTNFQLAQALCPHETQTDWQKARYTMAAYDWIGHGRNLAKQVLASQPIDKANSAKCKWCDALDSQEHCMIACSLPSLIPL